MAQESHSALMRILSLSCSAPSRSDRAVHPPASDEAAGGAAAAVGVPCVRGLPGRLPVHGRDFQGETVSHRSQALRPARFPSALKSSKVVIKCPLAKKRAAAAGFEHWPSLPAVKKKKRDWLFELITKVRS